MGLLFRSAIQISPAALRKVYPTSAGKSNICPSSLASAQRVLLHLIILGSTVLLMLDFYCLFCVLRLFLYLCSSINSDIGYHFFSMILSCILSKCYHFKMGNNLFSSLFILYDPAFSFPTYKLFLSFLCRVVTHQCTLLNSVPTVPSMSPHLPFSLIM